MFQSTHPRGVRRLFLGQSFARRRVSIHAPAWGATTCSRENLRSRKVVSIHAPAWGATEGREWLDQTPVVSIHAPAWGATPVSIVRLTRSIVSIHAPAWGATLAALDAQVRQLSFNPRTRVGCDHATRKQPVMRQRVSIHAPAWGATVAPRHIPVLSVVSIHAPAWGATHGRMCGRNSRVGFNPRTRVGCDEKTQSPRGEAQQVSIHAPAWGATGLPVVQRPLPGSFNPRTRVGCDTPTGNSYTGAGSGFNPRTRVGCDASYAGFSFFQLLFQSTHPRGVRPPEIPPNLRGSQRFNPRTRVGCDPALRVRRQGP